MTTHSTHTNSGNDVAWTIKYQSPGWNAPWAVYASGAYSSVVEDHVTVGQDTARFYARKRKGELLPFTFFDQYQSKVTRNSGNWSYQTNNWSATTGKQVRVENSSYDSPETFGIRYKSSYVVYDPVVQALASSASGWDALTFVAEAHQLRGLVLSLTKRLTDVLRGRPSKIPVNKWLEMRYGWRPLYYDMVSIIQAINSLNTKRRFSSYTSGNSTRVATSSFSTASEEPCTRGTVSTVDVSINIRAKLVMKGELSPITVNPLKTGWELIKFSFVVDWLLSVGKAIDALSLAFSGAHYVAGVGYKATVSNRVTHSVAAVKDGWTMLSTNFGDTTCEGECVSREPATIPLRPFLAPHITAGRLVDAIALLLQRIL